MDFQVKSRDAMARRDKIHFAALIAAYLASIIYYAVWWFNPQHIPMNWPELGYLGLVLDVLVFATLSFVIWRGVVLNLFAFWVVSSMKVPIHEPPEPGLRVAMMTCFVPGQEPYGVLEKTLTAMKGVRYPHDTWVLDEGDDPVVKAMCQRLDVKHFSRKGIPEYNQPNGKFRVRTKGGNHNAWADSHGREYDFVAQMDVDFVPRPEFLERTLGYFKDAKVAFVGSPQIHGNQSESWIAQGAAEQVFIFYGPMQKGFFGKGMQLLIGGNHVYRTEAWRDVDGYAESVTEDHVTGMKVYAKGWKSVFVPEILCVGETPSDMLTYLGQQMRWAFGLTDILIRYTPGLIGKLNWIQRIGFVNLQLFYFFGFAQLLAITLITLYLAFGITATTVGFTDWAVHAAPPFFINISVFLWLRKFCIDPENENVLGVRGVVLMFAAWPMYVLGLFFAMIRHRLSYNITRKGAIGQSATNEPSIRILIPYAIAAAISLAGLVAFPLTGFNFPPLVFWAAANFGTMFVVVLTMWQQPIPSAAPVYRRSLQQAFPVAMASATTAGVLFASMSVPGLFNIKPYGDLLVSTKYVRAYKPVEARFLAEDSRGAAVGALAYSDDELEKIAKISHFFINWQPEQLPDMISGMRHAAANKQIAMISWQPTFLTNPDPNPDRPERLILQQIQNGDFDDYIAKVANLLKNTGQPIILRFAHEMDIDDDGLHPWAEQPPDQYIAAFRHVHRIFEEEEVKNVNWLWSPSGQWKDGRFISLDWYPGDQYVDMVGLSIFVYWRWDEWNEERKAAHSYRTPEEIIGWSYDQVVSLGKPVVLAEVGVDLHPERKAEKKQWMQSMLDLVRDEQYSNIKAVVFFNQPHPFAWDADWRLNPEEERLVLDTIKADDFFELSVSQSERKLVTRRN